MSETSFPFYMPICAAGRIVAYVEGRCDCNSDSTINPCLYQAADDKAVLPTDQGHVTKAAVESWLWANCRDRIDECMDRAIKTAKWQARADARTKINTAAE